MPDSSTVRKINKDKIRLVMRDGGEFSKQQIAQITGLSVATCNTLLNELEKDGELTGTKKRLNDVGRSTVVYRMRDEYESYLCALITPDKNKRPVKTDKESSGTAAEEEKGRIHLWLLSPTDKLLEEQEEPVTVSPNALADYLKDFSAKRNNIRRIILGIRGQVSGGRILKCAFESLQGAYLSELITGACGISCIIDNDLAYTAYAVYKNQEQKETGRHTGDTVVSVIDFSEKKLPVCVSVYEGKILEGYCGAGGSVGYLPFGVSGESQRLFYKSTTFMPFAIKIATAVIAMVNPGKIVLTGSLMEEKNLSTMKKLCVESIPPEWVPEMELAEDEVMLCRTGMYYRAQEAVRNENSMDA